MIYLPQVFAAGDFDLIKAIIVVVFILVAGIAQLVAKIRQIPPPANRPNPPQPDFIDVADEIEKFLRRKIQGDAPETRPVEVEPPQIAETPSVAAAVKKQEPPPKKSVGGQVGEHVKKYLDEQDFTNRADHLGEEVAQADEQANRHLQQVFDHRVSKLEAVPGEAAVPPVAYEPPDLVGAAADIPQTFATGLLDMVNNPESLRQAIILNEILHRPEERWT